jgi:hypothetical protein
MNVVHHHTCRCAMCRLARREELAGRKSAFFEAHRPAAMSDLFALARIQDSRVRNGRRAP